MVSGVERFELPNLQRAQLPAARRARRRRHHLPQDRRPGQGVLDGAAPDGNPGSGGAGPPADARHERAARLRSCRRSRAACSRLTLNRPDKRNALSSELIEALHAALERADLDADGARRGAARGGQGLLRRRRPRRAARLGRPDAGGERGRRAAARRAVRADAARCPSRWSRWCTAERWPAGRGW